MNLEVKMMQFGERHSVDTGTNSDNVAVSEERRSDRRRRVLKGANIYFNKGYAAFDCIVKNLSDAGAMVKMEDSSGLPGVFEFAIKGEDARRPACISWRQSGKAGIRFL
jgi:hypothetical protein